MLELQFFSCFFLDIFVFKNYNFAMIKKWQRKRIGCPAVSYIKIDIFIFLSHLKNICILEFIFYTKITAKSISTRTALISFNKIKALISVICVNVKSIEPAAVLGFPVKAKVVERIQPESTAAGSLFGWSLGGKVSKVRGERKEEVIMNIEQRIPNVEGREGRSQMTEYRRQK
jgi:hypothetical protein